MSKKSRVLGERTQVQPIVVVGTDGRAVVGVAQRIAEYWPVIHVKDLAAVEGQSMAGIAFADGEAMQNSSPANYTVPVALVHGRSRELDRLLVHVLARHYTRIGAVAAALADFAYEHQLTLKQAELAVLFCTELTRDEIRTRLSVSENTLKTRVRMLCRQVDAPLGTAQLAQRILRRAAQTLAERAEPEFPVPPAPEVSLGSMPSVGRGRSRAGGSEALSEAGVPQPLSSMAVLRQFVPDALQALPVGTLPGLSVGLRRLAEESPIASIAELLAREDLSGHLRHSLAKSCELLVARADALRDTSADATSLLAAFERRVSIIENEARRSVLERRSGLKGRPDLLITLAKERGVSRERVRQLEVAAVEETLSMGFRDLLRSRISPHGTGPPCRLTHWRAPHGSEASTSLVDNTCLPTCFRTCSRRAMDLS